MNCVKYEKPNPNSEIEKFNIYKKIYDEKKNGNVSIEGIITSVETFTGRDTKEMSIYKLYALFNRIGQFKNFDSSVLFKTVSDIEISGWYEDTKENKEEQLDEHSKKILEDFRNTGEIKNNYQTISQNYSK